VSDTGDAANFFRIKAVAGTPTLAKEARLAVNDQQADRILADTFATAGNVSSAAS
jgi:hypothetical protein